jgi:hypothetical protein
MLGLVRHVPYQLPLSIWVRVILSHLQRNKNTTKFPFLIENCSLVRQHFAVQQGITTKKPQDGPAAFGFLSQRCTSRAVVRGHHREMNLMVTNFAVPP